MSTQELQEVIKYPPGTFSWIDLATADQEASKQFYTRLFGWTYEDMPIDDGQHYTMFRPHGKNVAGCGPMPAEQQEQGFPAYWGTYITVTDADAATEKATAAGGTVMAPPFDVFDSGRMAVIQDPSGGVFGVWQPYNHIGASLVNMANAWVWNELMTRDVDTAIQFYIEVFGWTAHKEPDPADGNPYVMLMNGARAAAGLMQITPEMGDIPPNWTIYFHVEDLEAATEKAKTLGGKTLIEPLDTGAGRLIVIQDPQGAIFNLIHATTIDPPPQG